MGRSRRVESDARATVLSGRDGPVLILDFHNHVMLIDPDTLLVWHQRHVETGPSAPVVLRIFRVQDLRRLEGEMQDLCSSMRRSGAPLISFSWPVCEFPVPTSDAGCRLRLSFPDQLRHLDELLILCHSSAVEESPPVDRSNLALLVVAPEMAHKLSSTFVELRQARLRVPVGDPRGPRPAHGQHSR